jgi:Spy/CpxP family protein refolding chaperone
MVAICLLATAATTVLAQGRGGGGPPPGGGGGGGMGGPPPFGGQGGQRPEAPPTIGNPTSSGSGERGGQSSESQVHGLQLGPPREKWWDDNSFAKKLKLRPEQQTRMDAIFDQNKGALFSRLQGLEQAEAQMDEITRSRNLDESALFTQIDRVAQARADLEKAKTHMLLQLRKEMDADQIDRLEKRH